MMARLLERMRQRRMATKAYSWVVRMDDDRTLHESGLRRWIGSDPERCEIYNRAYRAYRDASAPASKIYGTARERGAKAAARGIRSIPYGSLIAIAACLLLFGILVTAGSSRFVGRGTFISSPGKVLIATRIGEVRAIRLVDGSTVLLDTNTSILVDISKPARSIVLRRGRARFEVAHYTGWPFVVSAGGGTVTAKGTVFDVEVADDVRVNLISGIVEVRYPTRRLGVATVEHILSSGQKISFNSAMPVPNESPTAALPSDGQWISGMRTYDDVPVSQIILEANRYTDRKIELSDDIAGDNEVFLDVDIRNPREVARKLATLLSLDVDETDPSVIRLKSRRK